VTAAGATGVMNAVSMMTGTLAGNDGTEDVIITLDSHCSLIRLLSRGRRWLLLVPPGRPRAAWPRS